MKDFKKKLGALCLALSALSWSIPNVARAEIVKQQVPTVYKSGVDKIADACEGYTQQSCDVVTTNADGSLSRTPQTFNCCGKKECQNMLDPNDPTRCKVSRVFAHGSRDTCTEPEQVSPCGKSCCGKEDCASVCNNYRLDVCKGYNQDPNGNKCCGKEDCERSACGYWTVTTEDMGTPGIACCGYLDCANKACGGYTYTESKVFPEKGKLACCGKEDCEKRACGGATQTTGAYGGLSGLACCGDGPNLEGSPNCRLTECQNYIQTTSVSDLAENKKKLECCGPGKIPGNPANKQWGNCWQVHCDNYISTIVEDTKDENGKNGTSVDCCGYLDCLNKQCSGRTSVVPWGKGSNDAIQCCGEKQCEKEFLDSVPPVPPKKTVTIQSAERVIESYIPGYRPQCRYKNHVVTETREVLGICEVKKVSKKICAPNVTCEPMGGERQCDNVIVDELYCNEHDGRLCKKWKESFTSVCNDDEQIGSIYHQTVCGEVVEYKCVEW